jgi:hypothetical protein
MKGWVKARGVSKHVDQVQCWPGCTESYILHKYEASGEEPSCAGKMNDHPDNCGYKGTNTAESKDVEGARRGEGETNLVSPTIMNKANGDISDYDSSRPMSPEERQRRRRNRIAIMGIFGLYEDLLGNRTAYQ